MEQREFGPTGDHVSFNEFGKKHSMSHNTRVTNTDEIRRDGMRRRVRAAPSLTLFWRCRLGSDLWAEGAIKCHPKNSDGGIAIEVLSVSVWVYPSVLVLFGTYVVAVVTAVLLCVTHSESVPVRVISEEEHNGSCW